MRSSLLVSFACVALMSVPALAQAQSIDDLFRQGNAAQDAGDYEQAEATWRQILRLAPDDADAYYNLGNALADQERHEEAESAYREAIRLNPDYADAYSNLGITLADQERHEEAESAFRNVIRLAPDNALAYNNLGAVLTDQGRYEEAESAFRNLIRLEPGNASAYFHLGNGLYDQGRYEEAESAYREAIRLNPDYARAYNNLGAVLTEQERYEEAESAYREAIRLNPEYALVYNNLGNALAGQERYEEAESAYREAIRLNPDNAFAYNNFGVTLADQGRYEEAIAFYEQALRLDPDYTAVQNNLAEAQRLLALRTAPPPSRQDDLAWLPPDEVLLPVLRAVVRVVTPTPTGTEIGTGFVVRREGSKIWVLTNRHVVTTVAAGLASDTRADQRAQRQAGTLSTTVEVDFYSEPPAGRVWLRLPATVVKATSPQDDLDLALLVIDNAPDDIQPLELASTVVSIDTNVRIIGHHRNPWGLARGYISERPQGTALQFAGASIGRRSSGSPILNDQDQVVGIVTSIEPPNVRIGNDFLSGFSYGHPSSNLLETLNLWIMD